MYSIPIKTTIFILELISVTNLNAIKAILTGEGIDGATLGLFKFSGGDEDSLVTPPFNEPKLNLESNREFLELFDLNPKNEERKKIQIFSYLSIFTDHWKRTHAMHYTLQQNSLAGLNTMELKDIQLSTVHC